jgi:photosynthetic reaction center H subunit
MSTIGAVTSTIDVAQLVLYAFWVFFAGLIYYLHRENKREGYPLVSDRSAHVVVQGWPPVPAPKTYRLADGSTVSAPRAAAPDGAMAAQPTGPWPGAPLVPTGNPLVDGIGPAAWAAREDVVELTYEGAPKIVPLRNAEGYEIAEQDIDPRGMTVVGADGVAAGTVHDLWVDRSDVVFRYLEVGSPGIAPLLVPLDFVNFVRGRVQVNALMGGQFALVPRLRSPEQVTRLEEEKIVAYFGGGTLYAEPRRAEPLL